MAQQAQGKREGRLAKLATGFYRFSVEGNGFSNIHKRPDGWHADIRNSNGDLLRYAGIWSTRKAAIDEARSIMETA